MEISLVTISKEPSNYKLHSVGVQEVRGENDGSEHGKEIENNDVDKVFFR
jgi:hypothetical protein